MTVCPTCDRDMHLVASCTDVHFAKPWQPATPGRCGDCGVQPNGLHHPGCAWARCAVCGDQAMACQDGYHKPLMMPLDGGAA